MLGEEKNLGGRRGMQSTCYARYKKSRGGRGFFRTIFLSYFPPPFFFFIRYIRFGVCTLEKCVTGQEDMFSTEVHSKYVQLILDDPRRNGKSLGMIRNDSNEKLFIETYFYNLLNLQLIFFFLSTSWLKLDRRIRYNLLLCID